MVQEKKAKPRIKREEDQGSGEAEVKANLKEKGDELRKKLDALLKKIDEALKEHKSDSCPASHKPHIHLCDGTKVDLTRFLHR